MNLNIAQRLTLLCILPEKGNYVTLKIIDDLKRDLSFTEAEVAECNIKVNEDNGSVTWNGAKSMSKDIEIGEKSKEIISKALKILDDKEELTVITKSLYELFNQNEVKA